MDAETRAALERAIDALDPKGQGGWCTKEEIARLQALLDEKGGSGVRDGERSRTVNPVASAEQVQILPATPSPDSPAKIAAEMRDWLPVSNPVTNIIIEGWAARVEALGLEPSEREIVRKVAHLAHERGAMGGMGCCSTCRATAAALAPIAERKP